MRARPTAVLTHGANPGLVSHFVKQALLNIAADTGVDAGKPGRARRVGRARAAARRQGDPHRRARHAGVAACRSSRASSSTPGRSTASSARAAQPAELGWGTHERNFPRDGRRHDFGCRRAIYLTQPGAATRVRTWTPRGRPLPRLSASRTAKPSRSPTTSRCATARRWCTARPCTTPTTRAIRRCMSVHELAGRNYVHAGAQAHPHGRHHRRHRRARRAARRTQEERLLVRLAAVDRARRASSRPTTTPPACRSPWRCCPG